MLRLCQALKPFRTTKFPPLLSPLLTGLCVKMCYIKYSGPIKKGEKIDVLLPMQRVYRGITSPVCIQNWLFRPRLPTCYWESQGLKCSTSAAGSPIYDASAASDE
uniref:Uncharacterized protein n=1 Tax=Falco tinnunculus TaxID=100819 RepID=A0A8C4XQB3_FALTI